MKTSLKGLFLLSIVSSVFLMDVWILSRNLGFKCRKYFCLLCMNAWGCYCTGITVIQFKGLIWLVRNQGTSLCRAGLCLVCTPPRVCSSLLWECGSQRSQARGFHFFSSSPEWTLRPQLPLQDPFLPSKQMFSGHLSSFVGWAPLWILVFSWIFFFSPGSYHSNFSGLCHLCCFQDVSPGFFWLTFSLFSVENWPKLPCPPWSGVHMKNEWPWPCYVRKSNTCLIHGRRLNDLLGLIFVTKSPTLARHTAVLVMKDEWCHCHEVTLLAPVFLSSQAEVAIVKESGDLVSVLALPLVHSLPRVRKILPFLGLCFFFFFFNTYLQPGIKNQIP